MAFQKLGNINTPSFQDVIGQLHTLQTQRLNNQAMSMQNNENMQTQQGRVGAANSGYGLAMAQHGAQRELLPMQTNYAKNTINSQEQLLPYQTTQGIAQAKQGAAKANLETANPLIGMPGNVGVMGVIDYLRGQQPPGAAPQPAPDQQPKPIMGKPGSIPARMKGVNDYQEVIGMTQPQPAMAPTAGGNSGLGFDLSTPQGKANALEKMMFAQQEKDIAMTKRYNILSTPYNNMTVDQKREAIATAAGWGFSKDVATKFLIDGGTMPQLEQMARDRGVDVDNAIPQNAATSATITADQKTLGREAELVNIEPKINAALMPYAQRFAGMSLKQIADSASGQNPKQLGQYLGARAMQPEMASIRGTIMGAENGIEAIKMVKELMYGKLRDAELNMNPETFQAMQDFISDTITEGFKARRKATYNVGENAGLGKKVMDKSKAADLTGDFMGVLG